MPKTDKRPAPYIPFKTFLTALEVLEQGYPDQIDKSVWPTFSFGNQTHTLSAFRFLQLIDDEGNVQEGLRRLVHEKADRKGILAEILRKRYPTVVALGQSNATSQQLQDTMRNYAVSGSVLDKAIRFFIQAAEYAGIPLSPLWAKQKRRGTSVAARRRQTSRKRPRQEAHRGQDGGTPAATQEEAPPASAETIELESGGSVTLSVDIDAIRLSLSDRQFVFGLIDKLREYGQRSESPQRPEGQPSPEEEVE